MIAHACSVWPEGVALPSTCITAMGVLEKSGQRQAAIAATQKLLAVVDDPMSRAELSARLERLKAAEASEGQARDHRDATLRLSQRHMADIPSASRARYQLIAPATDPVACLGLRSVSILDDPDEESGDTAKCASAYARWRLGRRAN